MPVLKLARTCRFAVGLGGACCILQPVFCMKAQEVTQERHELGFSSTICRAEIPTVAERIEALRPSEIQTTWCLVPVVKSGVWLRPIAGSLPSCHMPATWALYVYSSLLHVFMRACLKTCIYKRHVCIYMYVYIYMYLCIYTYTCIHTYMHTCMHTCMHTYVHTCIHMYSYRSIDGLRRKSMQVPS